ncbi:hypothetical protein DL93DRAFT_2234135 [Clavulina sp. PMI_390]|nr:hypothetical protein DL93DRAFT_2234135 [Clavulina sp. PMI_390]
MLRFTSLKPLFLFYLISIIQICRSATILHSMHKPMGIKLAPVEFSISQKEALAMLGENTSTIIYSNDTRIKYLPQPECLRRFMWWCGGRDQPIWKRHQFQNTHISDPHQYTIASTKSHDAHAEVTFELPAGSPTTPSEIVISVFGAPISELDSYSTTDQELCFMTLASELPPTCVRVDAARAYQQALLSHEPVPMWAGSMVLPSSGPVTMTLRMAKHAAPSSKKPGAIALHAFILKPSPQESFPEFVSEESPKKGMWDLILDWW